MGVHRPAGASAGAVLVVNGQKQTNPWATLLVCLTIGAAVWLLIVTAVWS